MSKISTLHAAVLAALAALCTPAAQAATFTSLHSFTAAPDGREPGGGLTPLAGKLYGTTSAGGDLDSGVVYRIDPATGEETVLYSFTGAFGGATPDGSGPVGELLAVGGVLYGTTSFGGTFNGGTVFKFDPATGAESVVYSFGSGVDGATPAAGLIRAGAVLYGTTSGGGAGGLGTVFALNLATGAETRLHDFAGGDDGAAPFAPLIFERGRLYGTTFFGGPSNDGVVFSVNPATGREKVLHAFAGNAFSGNPSAGLTFHNGLLYGTTAHGGLPNCDGGGCGTVFQVDAATGAESDVYSFTSRIDGEDPEAGLVYTGGKLVGTTLTGGLTGQGTIFAVDPQTGTKSTLHVFNGPGAGINPGTLVHVGQAFYGATHGGGDAGQGSVFELGR